MIKLKQSYNCTLNSSIQTNVFDSKQWSIRRNKALLNDIFLTIENKKIVNDNDIVILTNHINPNNKLNSLFFNKNDSCIKIKNSDCIDFGIEDFTIDWWEYNLKISNKKQQLINKRDNNKTTMLVENTNYKTFSASSSGNSWDIAKEKQMGVIQNKKWIHWAIIKANGTFYTFKNGAVTNKWSSKQDINIPSDVFTIGSYKNNTFYGYINKFRILRHTALWSEEFKLSTEELFY